MCQKTVCRPLICFLSVFFAPAFSFASVLGPDFPVWDWVGVDACNESEPAVAYASGEAEWWVVWSDYSDGPRHIYGQSVLADGFESGGSSAWNSSQSVP